MQYQRKHPESRVKPNLTVYDKITRQTQQSINSVWWSAACRQEMGKRVEFLFPPIPIKPFPFPWN